METKIVKNTITRDELEKIAEEQYGNLVKAVVDIRQEIMAVGGELHADEEVLLIEEENSRREDTWGINLYPARKDEKWVEFDSVINIKPAFGNRSRDVENDEIKEKVRDVVKKLVAE